MIFIINMQNQIKKTNGAFKKKQDEAYVKRLQKIVYEKEKQLQSLSQNIQVQQLRLDYQKKIDDLQSKVNLQKKIVKQKDAMMKKLQKDKQQLQQKLINCKLKKQNYQDIELLKTQQIPKRFNSYTAQTKKKQISQNMTNRSDSINQEVYYRNNDNNLQSKCSQEVKKRLVSNLNESVLGEIEENKQRFEQAKVIMESLGQKIEILTYEISEQERQILELRQENNRCKRLLQRQQDQKLDLRRQLQIQIQRCNGLRNEIQQYNKKEEDWNEQRRINIMQIKRLNRQMQEWRIKCENIRQRWQQQKEMNNKDRMSENIEQMNRLRQQVKINMDDKIKLSDKLKSSKLMYDQRIKQIKKSYQKQIQNLFNQIQNISNQKNTLQINIFQKDAQIKKFKISQIQLQNTLIKYQNQLQSLKTFIYLQKNQYKNQHTQILSNIQKLKLQNYSYLQNISLYQKTLQQINQKYQSLLSKFQQYHLSPQLISKIQKILPHFLQGTHQKVPQSQLIYKFIQQLYQNIIQKHHSSDIINLVNQISILKTQNLNSFETTIQLISKIILFILCQTQNVRSSQGHQNHNICELTTQTNNNSKIMELSEILKQVSQLDKVKVNNYIKTAQQQHNEQLLLQNLERQVQNNELNNSQVRHQQHNTQVSEIRMNYKMIKQINEQLFKEIQSKQTELKQLNDKQQKLNNNIDMIKNHFKSLIKQTKLNQKNNQHLANISAILQLKN